MWTVLLAVAPRDARAEICSAVTPPLITVRAVVRPPTYDFSRGVRDLSSDMALAVPRGMEDFKYAFGVTAVVSRGETQWELNGILRNDGGMCWSVSNVKITVTASTKVFIAKEIIRDSCLWQQVTAHEARHVKMDRKLLPRLPDSVRPSVLRKVSRSVAADSAAEANAVWQKIISQSVSDAMGAFRERRNQAQLTIDTREEYTRASRACGATEVAATFARAGIK